jgi:CheY-like chemotaxis protein
MSEPKRVLVIDDDTDYLEFVKIILESEGYRVFTAKNADEGLSLAKTIRPDVALVDVMMSYVLDGLGLTQTMRSDPDCASIPIMLVSAIISTESDGLLPRGQQLECDAFMSKPVNPQDLLLKVAELVNAEHDSNVSVG